MPATRLIVRGSPIPPDFLGNLNDLWQAMLNRLEIISPFGEVNLRIGGLMPTTNVGPWLNGKQWWVWDEATKTYVPLDVSASLPDINALIAAALTNYATQTYVNDQIAAAIAGSTTNFAKFYAYLDIAIPVSIATASPFTKVTFTKTLFDTGPNNFNTGSSQFVAPATGYYFFDGSLRIDFLTGTGFSDISVLIQIRVNGDVNGRIQREPSLAADRDGATLGYSGLLQLNVGDVVDVWAAVNDSTVTGGTAQITNDPRKSVFSGYQVP